MDAKEIMSTAREINYFWGVNLDEAIKTLETEKKSGNNVYIDFNGHRLYSLLDDENSCYMKVLKKSKVQWEKDRRESLKRLEQEIKERERQAEIKIPKWVERGEKLIYPQRRDSWKHCVDIRVHDLYHGMDLDNALDIMECLENGGTVEEANKILEDANHSGMSYGIVLSIIVSFSKRGPEFYRSVKQELNSQQIAELDKIEQENQGFEREVASQEKE